MYAAIWRLLPGPWLVRLLLALLLVAGAVYALFTWGFPWAADEFDLLDTTVGAEAG